MRHSELKKRALNLADKDKKMGQILDVAAKLFADERQLQTVASLAKAAGIAKGTVYLYFKTKEEIYMELLVRGFEQWHGQLREFILDNQPDISQLVDYMCRSLLDYQVFVDLTVIAAVVLEENLHPEYIRDARLRMRAQSQRSAQLISLSFPAWSAFQVEAKLRRFYVYAMGYWRECFPVQKVVDAIPDHFASAAERRQAFLNEILQVSSMFWRPPQTTRGKTYSRQDESTTEHR
jgi:AcrR family transcriptional regulator